MSTSDAARPLVGKIAVVPVPLYAGKRAQRGFNQAEMIARAALKRISRPERFALCTGVLLRRRETGSQIGLTRHQRRENLRGAFAVKDATQIQKRDGGVEACTVAYLAGCDGARSTVRDAIRSEFPGGTYEHLFYVADVDAGGATVNGELHIALDETDFLVVFPLKGEGRVRLIGTVRQEAEHPRSN